MTGSRSCPYMGLHFYTAEDKEYFFGRGEDAIYLAEFLLGQNVTVLHGPTGVGKSSLLQAGLPKEITAIEPDTIMLPWSKWQPGFRSGLLKAIGGERSRRTRAKLDEIAEERMRERGHAPLVLLLDQFDEYFTHHAQGGDEAFERDLARLINRRDLDAHVLIAIREDAFFQLSRLQPRIPFITVNALRLDHLDEVAARQVIEEPLKVFNKKHGTSWEPDPDLVRQLIEKVYVKEARSPVTAADRGDRPRQVELPLLQLALVELWDEESKAGSQRLRLETLVKQLGDVEGILDRYVQKGLDGLDPVQQEVCARLLDRLVTPTGMRAAFRFADLQRYAAPEGEPSDRPEGAVRQVVDHLDRQRLLHSVPDPRHPEQPLYEVFHDVLAKPLRQWQSRRQDVARARQLLARARQALEDGNARHAALLALEQPVLDARQVDNDIGSELQRLLADSFHQPIERKQYQLDSRPQLVAINENGQRLVTAGDDSPTTAWELVTGQEFFRLDDEFMQVQALAISADGSRIITGSRYGGVKLWDGETGTLLTDLDTTGFTEAQGDDHDSTPPFINDVAISANGQRCLVAVSDDNKQVLRLWDDISVCESHVSLSVNGKVLSAAVSCDDFAVIGYDSPRSRELSGSRGIEWRRTSTLDNVFRIELTDKTVRKVLTSGGGDMYAALADGAVHLCSGRQSPRSLEHGRLAGGVLSLALCLQGKVVLTGAEDEKIRLWDAESGRERFAPFSAGGPIRALGWLEAADTVIAVVRDCTVKLWDIPGGRPMQAIEGHANAVTAIAFTPDGRRIVSGGQDRRVRLWDATTGKATGGLPDHERRVLALAVSPDGRRIATGAADGIVRLWDAASQRPVGRLEAHEGPASALAYGTHDRLVSGSWDGTAIVWDALVRRPAQRLVGHAAPIAAVACSPDGEVVATASDDGTARLWHAPSGTERRRLEGHGGPVYAAAFDAAGRRLATGGADGVVRLWNAATGELEQELSGHQEAVRCLAFLPDGELLASGSLDGTVRLWDLAPDGPSPRTLSAGRAMRAIAVSPDGRRLAAGTGDGRVLVWRLLPRDLEGLLAHAAELRLEPLSEEERRQFGLSPSSIGQRQAPG